MSSTSKTPAGLIFGAAPFGVGVPDNPNAKFATVEAGAPIFKYLQKKNIVELDSARAYPPGTPGKAEEYLGLINAGSWATIDTKVNSRKPGDHSAKNIAASVEESLAALKVDKVRIMYLHMPDRSVPFEETAKAIDEQYRLGRFEQFGLSNYHVDEVKQFIDIAEKNGYIKPSVYQGQYNAAFRGGEKELFPLLRKHNMAFYAFTPTGAGIFSGKITRESANSEGSRWDSNTGIGKVYQSMYFKDSVFEATSKIAKAAEKLGITGHAAALRWVVYHSILNGNAGDKIILGVSSLEQLESNMAAYEAGPLPDELVALFQEAWTAVGEENSVYHF